MRLYAYCYALIPHQHAPLHLHTHRVSIPLLPQRRIDQALRLGELFVSCQDDVSRLSASWGSQLRTPPCVHHSTVVLRGALNWASHYYFLPANVFFCYKIKIHVVATRPYRTLHQLSRERLASLGTIEGPLSNPPYIIVVSYWRGSQFVPHYAKRLESLYRQMYMLCKKKYTWWLRDHSGAWSVNTRRMHTQIDCDYRRINRTFGL